MSLCARRKRWGRPLLVVGFSGRAAAASAYASGLPVCVVDACADVDMRALTGGAFGQVPVCSGGFDEHLLTVVRSVVQECRPFGWVMTSGLESAPQLIDAVTREVGGPLYGNPGAVVAGVKDPLRLRSILRRCGLEMPETHMQYSVPVPPGWLYKRIGSCGGGHVRPALPGVDAGAADYVQCHVAGVPGSVTFLADGHRVRLLGMCRHYPMDPTRGDYRYSVVLSTRHMPGITRAVLPQALTRLVRETGLQGLCGIDFVIGPEGRWQVLEINPRWTAGAELHAQTAMALHLQACQGCLPPAASVMRTPGVRAAALCYVRRSLHIPEGLRWPHWVRDRPPAGRCYEAYDPICTVHAEAHTAHGVRARLTRRLRHLRRLLGNDALAYPHLPA